MAILQKVTFENCETANEIQGAYYLYRIFVITGLIIKNSYFLHVFKLWEIYIKCLGEWLCLQQYNNTSQKDALKYTKMIKFYLECHMLLWQIYLQWLSNNKFLQVLIISYLYYLYSFFYFSPLFLKKSYLNYMMN